MTSDPFDILLKHFEWGTSAVIDAARHLSDEQLDHPFEMGVGTLRKSIDHIIAAAEGWTWRLDGAEDAPYPRPEASPRPTLDELSARLTAAGARLAETVASDKATGRLADLLEFQRNDPHGKPVTYRYTRAVVIIHALSHGNYHRAQCLNMLRQLGVSPLPMMDVTSWQRLAEADA
ncbi:MAG: DinB family protein [Phycisphaerae bacterium]